MKTEEVIEKLRALLASQPEMAAQLREAADLDSAAFILDRVGAQSGIATSAMEIRAYVRGLVRDARESELPLAQLNEINAGRGVDLELSKLFELFPPFGSDAHGGNARRS